MCVHVCACTAVQITQEKRILVTAAVGEHHRARVAAQLAGSTYASLFRKTGTYLDVSHCFKTKNAPDNGPEDAEVDLQGGRCARALTPPTIPPDDHSP